MAAVGTVTIPESGGGENYDVYGSLALIDTYFNASTRFTTWDALTNDEKSRALVEATRTIDKQIWQGEQTNTVTPQPLEWPRTGVTCRGDAVDSATVPDDICSGTFELAFNLAAGGTANTDPDANQNTKKLKAGSAQIEYFSPLDTVGRFPTIIQEYIECFLAASTSTSISVSSGFTDSCDSQFSDSGKYNLNDPYA